MQSLEDEYVRLINDPDMQGWAKELPYRVVLHELYIGKNLDIDSLMKTYVALGGSNSAGARNCLPRRIAKVKRFLENNGGGEARRYKRAI